MGDVNTASKHVFSMNFIRFTNQPLPKQCYSQKECCWWCPQSEPWRLSVGWQSCQCKAQWELGWPCQPWQYSHLQEAQQQLAVTWLSDWQGWYSANKKTGRNLMKIYSTVENFQWIQIFAILVDYVATVKKWTRQKISMIPLWCSCVRISAESRCVNKMASYLYWQPACWFPNISKTTTIHKGLFEVIKAVDLAMAMAKMIGTTESFWPSPLQQRKAPPLLLQFGSSLHRCCFWLGLGSRCGFNG